MKDDDTLTFDRKSAPKEVTDAADKLNRLCDEAVAGSAEMGRLATRSRSEAQGFIRDVLARSGMTKFTGRVVDTDTNEPLVAFSGVSAEKLVEVMDRMAHVRDALSLQLLEEIPEKLH